MKRWLHLENGMEWLKAKYNNAGCSIQKKNAERLTGKLVQMRIMT